MTDLYRQYIDVIYELIAHSEEDEQYPEDLILRTQQSILRSMDGHGFGEDERFRYALDEWMGDAAFVAGYLLCVSDLLRGVAIDRNFIVPDVVAGCTADDCDGEHELDDHDSLVLALFAQQVGMVRLHHDLRTARGL